MTNYHRVTVQQTTELDARLAHAHIDSRKKKKRVDGALKDSDGIVLQ
jgi:hypothetical protein